MYFLTSCNVFLYSWNWHFNFTLILFPALTFLTSWPDLRSSHYMVEVRIISHSDEGNFWTMLNNIVDNEVDTVTYEQICGTEETASSFPPSPSSPCIEARTSTALHFSLIRAQDANGKTTWDSPPNTTTQKWVKFEKNYLTVITSGSWGTWLLISWLWKSSIIIIYEKSTLLTVPFSASSRWLCGQITWSSSRTSLTASIRRSTRLCLRYIETSINAAANWVINMLVHILTIDMLHSCWILNLILQFTESSEALQKDVTCNKSKEHFLTAIRTLELMQV